MNNEKQKNRLSWLVPFKFAVSIAHWTLAVIIAVEKGDWKVGLSSNFLNWKKLNPDDEDEVPFIMATARHLDGYVISLKWFVFVFHLFSGLWQFLVAVLPAAKDFYMRQIQTRQNIMRWMEYSITAPVMILCIAIIEGQNDFLVLFLLMACTNVLMYLGLLTEINRQNVTGLISHFLGWILYLATWFCVTFNFYFSLNEASQKPPSRVKPWIVATYWTMVILFGCFGIVQVVDVFGDIKNYARIEFAYTMLSLISKTLLGIFVWRILVIFDDMQVEVVKS